jgi:hypothetical protein
MRSLLLCLLACSLAALTGTGTASAATWMVKPDGSGDVPTIQAAMDTAVAGDTVLVSCGIYYEHDIEVTNGVYFTSATGASDCVTIDGQNLGRVLSCNSLDSTTSIVGFRITGGNLALSAGYGGGIYCSLSDPKVTSCAFIDNSAFLGGGAYLYYSSPVFTDCQFCDNYICDYDCAGGGAIILHGSPAFTNCIFSNNGSPLASGGGIASIADTLTVEGCLFERNTGHGGGLNFKGGTASLVGCTFAANDGVGGAGGIHFDDTASVSLERCIIALSTYGAAVGENIVYPIDITLACCDLYGNEGGDWVGPVAGQAGVNGNICNDPLFCDPDGSDFRLSFDSPCNDTDSCGTMGAYAAGCSTSIHWTDVTTGPLGDGGPGSGLAWADYDDDGDLDIYFTNRVTTANVLLRNDSLTAEGFTAATPAALADASNSRGCPWGDYDGDGDADLYICNKGANKLIRNDGGGTFTDVTAPPVDDAGTGQSAAWFDYDNDGDLDLYVVNNGGNKLFRNDGGGAFTDATTGPLGDAAWGMGLGLADYDSDGDMDIYLANYSSSANVLMENQGGGVFADVTPPALECAVSSYGAAWGDYDNDGDPDLYVSNEGDNNLFRNDAGVFTDVTAPPLDNPRLGRSAVWGDMDNDGDLDLYVVNDGANSAFINQGGGAFTETGQMYSPLGDVSEGYSAAMADYDEDGDLDLYVVNEGNNLLLRNELASGFHWLEVDPAGVVSNTDGVGARVRIVAGGVSQMREIAGASGFASQGPLTAWFGLGTETVVDTVEVTWPTGCVQDITDVACDQTLVVVEGDMAGVPGGVKSPQIFRLLPARPNPFSQVTAIRYELPEAAEVSLTVYDVSGRVICRLLEDCRKEPGYHAVRWNGLGEDSQPVAPGVYFCRLSAGTYTGVQRILLLR